MVTFLSLFDFWHSCRPHLERAALVSTLLLSILALFPLRLHTDRPKLESNFPHHIPQKLLRGGAGSSATHSSCTKERRNIFIFSLLLSSSLFLLYLFPMPK